MPQARTPIKKAPAKAPTPLRKAVVRKVPEKKDHTAAYAAGIALAVLILGFIAVWFYLQVPSTPLPEIAFAKFGPLDVHTRGYLVSTNVAVQTSSDNATWARQHTTAFSQLMQASLANADPAQLRTTEGLRTLQETLKDEINKNYQPPRVLNVFVTDLVLEAD